MASAGLAAIGLAALNSQGNAAWLFTLLMLATGGASWWWNHRRLSRLHLTLPGPVDRRRDTPAVPVAINGLSRVWLTAVIQRADGREERGPVTRIEAPAGLLPLPPAAPGDRAVTAIDASDRWPWGWFSHRRRWTCDLALGIGPGGHRADRQPLDLAGIRPWRPGDSLGRVVWRRLHQGLLARDFTHEDPHLADRQRALHTRPVLLPPPIVVPPVASGTVLLLLGSLLLGTLGLIPVLPLPLVGVAIALAWWRWRRAQNGAGAVGLVLRWLLVLGLLILLIALGALRMGLDGAVPVFIALAWIKALELDRDREVHLMATLGLFANGACLLADGGLDMFLLALTGAGLAGVALARHHGGPQTFGPLLAGVPLAAVAFLLLPRVTLGSTPLTGEASTTQTGVSSVMTPTSVARNLEDPTPVFRVEGGITGQSLENWYWRAHVLWECDESGSSWRPGFEPYQRDRATFRRPAVPQPVTCRLTLLPGATVPPALEMTIAPPPSQVAVSGGLVRWRRTSDKPVVYDLTADLAARDTSASETALLRARDLPERLDPQVMAIGERLRRETPAATATAVARWFVDEGFAYHMEPGTFDDGIAGFLLRGRRGFCAHYAAAGTILLRIAGLPARVVVGWRGGERNALGDYAVVRHSNAHAWCEYWDGLGWQRFDVTDHVPSVDPRTGRPDGPPRSTLANDPDRTGWWKAGAQALDYLEARWDLLVLGYDQDQRTAFLGRLGGVRTLVIAALSLATAGLALALWRRWRHRPRGPQRAYRAYLQALAHLGVPRRTDEGPRDHAQRAAACHPTLAPMILDGLNAHLRLTYARTARDDDLPRLESAARHLKESRTSRG